MNKDLNVKALMNHMKETPIPHGEVANNVMKKIHVLHSNTRHSKRRLRISPIWAAACVVLISAASVSASGLFKSDWNGIQVRIEGTSGQDAANSGSHPPAADNSGQSYREELEYALVQAADVWKTVSIEEAAKQASYPLLRPKESGSFKLVKSFGALLHDQHYRVKTPSERWLGGYYDVFQWKQTDIVVKQGLNESMTASLKDPAQTMSMAFGEADWENVVIADDALAMLRPSGSGNMLLVFYKTADRNVIELQLQGKASKDILVELAKIYMSK